MTEPTRYRNNMNNEYWWTPKGENEFLLNSESDNRPRMGGHVGVLGYTPDDLGVFEATGGPRVKIGDTVEGRVVNHIRSTDEGFVVTVD
jgi:hypothetical protein